MKIEIEIPKEFEEHFKQDKFKDSLERIMVDIWHSLENGNCLCAGNYEYETIEMLEKAFEDSREAYDIDKVVKELYEERTETLLSLLSNDYECEIINYCLDNFDKAIEIVKAGRKEDKGGGVNNIAEDAEEQGLLLRLPCKVGDDIYAIPSEVNYRLNKSFGAKGLNAICRQVVDHIEFNSYGYLVSTNEGMTVHRQEAFGETWFLTRDEAEQKLKELKEMENK